MITSSQERERERPGGHFLASPNSADFIIARIGVVVPHSMMGEITSPIAEAVATARGHKLFLPINQPHFEIVGIEWRALTKQISLAIEMIRERISTTQNNMG